MLLKLCNCKFIKFFQFFLNKFFCSFFGVFIVFKIKNFILFKLIIKKIIFQKENKRYLLEINMFEKFVEEIY